MGSKALEIAKEYSDLMGVPERPIEFTILSILYVMTVNHYNVVVDDGYGIETANGFEDLFVRLVTGESKLNNLKQRDKMALMVAVNDTSADIWVYGHDGTPLGDTLITFCESIFAGMSMVWGISRLDLVGFSW